jgi:hypothetical protein
MTPQDTAIGSDIKDIAVCIEIPRYTVEILKCSPDKAAVAPTMT